jgi:pyruvate/2-oxoglutarate dehydrogenase complex dihydrolipoamide dehydrogenase (E3) component
MDGLDKREGRGVFLFQIRAAADAACPGCSQIGSCASPQPSGKICIGVGHGQPGLVTAWAGAQEQERHRPKTGSGGAVEVVEHGPQLLDREDPDVADAIGGLFADEGIEVLLSAEALQVEGRSGDSVRLRVRTPQGERLLEGSDILVATGRTPNTAGIGLDIAGVRLDARGYVQVNDRLETSAPDVWAIGEYAGSPQFTHVSEDDFRVIRANLAGGSRTTRDRLIPFCLFTDPQLARIGLSETEARHRAVTVRVAKLPIGAVLWTRTTGETRGFMKALVEARSDRILGFTMFGPEAGEVMAAVQTAMLAGLPDTGLRDAILAHPTMAEGLGDLLAEVPPSAAG